MPDWFVIGLFVVQVAVVWTYGWLLWKASRGGDA